MVCQNFQRLRSPSKQVPHPFLYDGVCHLIQVFYSLERIQQFIDIEHEPQSTEDGKPPAAWPTSGDLRVENLSARYSQVFGRSRWRGLNGH